MGEWQPIETAPHDKPVLLFRFRWWGDSQIVVGRWVGSPEWWETHGGGSFMHPTRWMPLPDPPKDA